MQAMGTSEVQVAEPEADPGAELIAVVGAFKHSEAGLVQGPNCLREGAIRNRMRFGTFGLVSWPRPYGAHSQI